MPFRRLAAAALALLLSGCATPAASPAGPWRLVWADEFDGAGLAPERWTAERNCWGGGNGERQCYTDRRQNLAVAGGLLHLVARRERYSGVNAASGAGGPTVTRSYTSARIHTRGKAAWPEGRIEVRARLPAGQGLWPAIWLLPAGFTPGRGLAPSEIDIAEAVNLGAPCRACRGGVENRVVGSLHRRVGGALREVRGEAALAGPEAFHTYAVEWSATRIVWSLDGRPFHRVSGSAWREAREVYAGPYHLILNLAVGGAWAEATNARGIDGGAMPAEVAVDWVRVYAPTGKVSRSPG